MGTQSYFKRQYVWTQLLHLMTSSGMSWSVIEYPQVLFEVLIYVSILQAVCLNLAATDYFYVVSHAKLMTIPIHQTKNLPLYA